MLMSSTHSASLPPSPSILLPPPLTGGAVAVAGGIVKAKKGFLETMHMKLKRRIISENGDGGGDELTVATSVSNGEDLSPLVCHAFEAGKPDMLLHHLRNLMKKKELEIEDLCKIHYEDFIIAVDELRGVLVDADELKKALQSKNFQLQEVGSSLLLKLDELLESYAIKKNVTEAMQMSEFCVHVVNVCVKCNNEISQGRFYPALKSLDLIEKNYLEKVPVKALKKVIEQQIPAIKSYIEKKVCLEFNDWLVKIRSTYREIGQLAIGRAASARQRDEDVRARQREAEEQCHSNFGDCVYTLDVDEFDNDSDIKFDLTPVYWAYHIHKCLGLEDQFRDYYYKNRLLQLNSDWEVSSTQPFLESHQGFFAQIAGYFIVEDRVSRTAGGLLSTNQVESMWDTAIAKMTTMLEENFSRMDTASHLLLVKDYITLLAVTLRWYGYQISTLLEVLDRTQDKYHELLYEECRKQISDVLESDKYEPMVLRKEYEYNMHVVSFNLQTSDVMPAFPFTARFSPSVPDVCRIVRSFIDDSVNYLSYGGQINVFEVSGKYLEKLLINVLNEALLRTIHSSSTGVLHAMQIAANLSALQRACDLFLHRVAQLCGIPSRMEESFNTCSNARNTLKSSQDAAYHALINLVNAKISESMALTEIINWTADDAPHDANEYMSDVILFLGTFVSTAEHILTLDVLYKAVSGALTHISNLVVSAFLSTSVKRFSVNAVISIDNDLKLLEEFSHEKFQSTELINLKKEENLTDSLVEARQLLNLLLSDQPEDFMNPVIRERNYYALDYKKVANICEKFKDSPDRLFGGLANRNTKHNARRKSMDMLKRRLRDFN